MIAREIRFYKNGTSMSNYTHLISAKQEYKLEKNVCKIADVLTTKLIYHEIRDKQELNQIYSF